jgi:hypothetical protein
MKVNVMRSAIVALALVGGVNSRAAELAIPDAARERFSAEFNENQHSINESFDRKDAYLGVQKNLLTVLSLVGIEGVAEPLLARRR